MRVPVTIAADPAAESQEQRDGLGQMGGTFDIRIQRWHFTQKRGAPVGERVLDLVVDAELLGPQHPCLPERRDARQQFLVDRRVAIFGLALARFDQCGDRPFGIEDALAPHLGRMRSQHRHQAGIGEQRGQPLRTDAARVQCRHRMRQSTGSHRGARLLAAYKMTVLGDVREVGEVTERTDDVDRVVARQAAQQRIETTGCRRFSVAAEAQRGLADLLDRRIHRIALVGAEHVAEQLSQQPDVLAQRLVDSCRHQQASNRAHDA
jgi:hypothetical protein